MTNPPGHKELWKNINWKNREEKKAFFNKYFLNDNVTKELIKSKIDAVKKVLISFIENGEIIENKKKREINNKDIIEMIKEV